MPDLNDLVRLVMEFGTPDVEAPSFLLGHLSTVCVECKIYPDDPLWHAAISLSDSDQSVPLPESTPNRLILVDAKR